MSSAIVSIWTCLKFLSFGNGLATLTEKTFDNTVTIGENGSDQQFDFFSEHIIINPFPKKPWFLRVCSTSLMKTL